MAEKKGYVSNKEKKRQALEEQKKEHVYGNPSKTLAGKITIIILIAAMFAAPLIYIIWYLISSNT